MVRQDMNLVAQRLAGVVSGSGSHSHGERVRQTERERPPYRLINNHAPSQLSVHGPLWQSARDLIRREMRQANR